MPEEIAAKLKANGGKMEKKTLLCSFSSGEAPSDHLLAFIDSGLRTLEITKKVSVTSGVVALL